MQVHWNQNIFFFTLLTAGAEPNHDQRVFQKHIYYAKVKI